MLAASQAEHNHGYVSMLEGDLVRALQTMERVRAPLDSESELWAATNELDRAQALSDAGLITEAEASLANVARVFAKLSAVREQADAEYLLARSLLRHAPVRAARVAAACGAAVPSRRERRPRSAEPRRSIFAPGSSLGADDDPGAARRRLPAARSDRLDGRGAREAGIAGGCRGPAPRRTAGAAAPHAAAILRATASGSAKGLPLEVTLMTYEAAGGACPSRRSRGCRAARGRSRRGDARAIPADDGQPRAAGRILDARSRSAPRGPLLSGPIGAPRRHLRLVRARTSHEPAGRAAATAARPGLGRRPRRAADDPRSPSRRRLARRPPRRGPAGSRTRAAVVQHRDGVDP